MELATLSLQINSANYTIINNYTISSDSYLDPV